MLSNTLSLNLSYLKIIPILHPRYQTKTMEHILKNKVGIYSWHYTINHDENEDENEKLMQQIKTLDMNTNIVNKIVFQCEAQL